MNRDRIIFLGLALLILIIYGQSLWGDFVFDDRGILDYRSILSNLSSLKVAVLQPYWEVNAGLYRPVTLLSYALNIIFLGGSAFSFHLINLVLYFGICSAIYIFLKKLFNNKKLALFSVLIFLVMPIHTEVVANITGRSELLALFFSLLVLIEFTKEHVNFWLTGLYMFLAIGSKETAIAVLPLILLVIIIKESRIHDLAVGQLSQYFRSFSASVIGVCLYFSARFFVLGPDHFLGVETSLIENPLLFASTSDRIATAFSILWMYVQKTFWPFGLCSDYSYNQIPVLHGFMHLEVLLGGLVFVGSGVATLYFWKRQPVVALASGFTFFGSIFISNLFFPIGTIAGERLFFFASLGVALLFALALVKIKQRAVLVVLLAVYAILSFNRQGVWMSEEKLFLSAGECAPESVLSLSNLGTVHYFRGEYQQAEEVLKRSYEIKPIYSKGLNNLGLVYWKQGNDQEAMRLYHESLTQEFLYPGAIENLALLYAKKGDKENALRWLRIKYPNVDDSVLRSLF